MARQNGADLKDDKRYIPRWEVNNRILYSLEDDRKTQECCCRDLNCLGICLMTKEELPSNQKVKIVIYFSERSRIDVNGHIVWQKPDLEGYLVGVAFDNTNPEAQERILKYAFEVKRDDMVKHWFSGWK